MSDKDTTSVKAAKPLEGSLGVQKTRTNNPSVATHNAFLKKAQGSGHHAKKGEQRDLSWMEKDSHMLRE